MLGFFIKNILRSRQMASFLTNISGWQLKNILLLYRKYSRIFSGTSRNDVLKRIRYRKMICDILHA